MNIKVVVWGAGRDVHFVDDLGCLQRMCSEGEELWLLLWVFLCAGAGQLYTFSVIATNPNLGERLRDPIKASSCAIYPGPPLPCPDHSIKPGRHAACRMPCCMQCKASNGRKGKNWAIKSQDKPIGACGKIQLEKNNLNMRSTWIWDHTTSLGDTLETLNQAADATRARAWAKHLGNLRQTIHADRPRKDPWCKLSC